VKATHPPADLRPPCGMPTQSAELGCKTSFVPSATPGRVYEKSSREEWRRSVLMSLRRVFWSSGPRIPEPGRVIVSRRGEASPARVRPVRRPRSSKHPAAIRSAVAFRPRIPSRSSSDRLPHVRELDRRANQVARATWPGYPPEPVASWRPGLSLMPAILGNPEGGADLRSLEAGRAVSAPPHAAGPRAASRW